MHPVRTLLLVAALGCAGYVTSLHIPSLVYADVLSPQKYYLDVSPGVPIQQRLLVTGEASLEGEKTLYLVPVGMEKVGELDDSTYYFPDTANPAEPANWIHVPNPEVTVHPGEQVYIDWSVTPTAYAECGTGLAALMITDIPMSELAKLDAKMINSQTMSQIHLTVTSTEQGACVDSMSKLEVLDFTVDSSIPLFNYDAVSFVSRIKNNGRLISRAPKGKITISGLGDDVTIVLNEDALDVCPGITRQFTNTWVDSNYPHDGTFFDKLRYELRHFRVGRYEARLVVSDANSPIDAGTHFWVVPWRVAGSAVAVMFLILLVSRMIRRALKPTSP